METQYSCPSLKLLQRPTEHDSIDLAEKMWDLACRHLLGFVSRPEYQRGIRSLLDQFGAGASTS
jgi:hypothetical protein